MNHMHCILSCLLAAAMICGCGKPDNTKKPDDPEPAVEQPDNPPVPTDPADIPASDGTLRILAIGNSFSADAMEQELWPLFHAAGIKAIIGELYISGCDLEKHWKTASGNLPDYSYRKIVEGSMLTTNGSTFLEGLRDEKWDIISFQQGGGYHGRIETFEPWLGNLIDFCRENAPYRKFKTAYHAPWVAPAGSTNAKFANYDYNTDKMYSMIVDAMQKTDGLHHFDIILNSVDAIQNGRSSYLGDTFDRDGWHLNKTYGRYTAGCLWFERISGIDVTTNSYHPDTITDYVAEICRSAAHEACLHPCQVTDLSRFTDPDHKTGGEGKVLAEWEFSGTNAVEDAYISTFTSLPDDAGNLAKYSYSNAPGELGYVRSNKTPGGRISYVQTDKSAWSDASGNERAGRQISVAGLPTVCAALPGDYWLFALEDGSLPAGSKISLSFSWNSNKYGSKYWLLEYLDGNEWKSVPNLELKTETISGTSYDTNIPYSETITYNIAFGASEKRTIESTVELLSQTEHFAFRMSCCLEHQVNGRHFLHPRTQSVQNLDSGTRPRMVLLD